MDPTVTFLLVSYNRASSLRFCLNSIQQQSYSNKEIVVVSNGSTDETVSMIKDQFSNVKLIELPFNVGPSESRNIGLRLVTGEIAFLLDDDAILPDSETTSRVLKYFSEEFVAGVTLKFEEGQTGKWDYRAIPRLDKKIPSSSFACSYFCAGACAIRSDLMREIGGQWPQLFYSGEELDVSYRLIAKGYHFICATELRAVHYQYLEGRPEGQWLYYNLRNRPWIALRNLPWRYVISTSVLWWTYGIYRGFKEGQLRVSLKGVKDSIFGMPVAYRSRKPLSGKHLRVIHELSGRLWY